MSMKREQPLDFTVHYSHYQDVAHVFQSHVVRWLRTGFPVHGSCDERITPVLYKACAEPISNQYGFRGCSIARFFNDQITLGTHVTGKRWHRVLESTQKKSAGTSRSTPQFHVKNGMTRQMKRLNSSAWTMPSMYGMFINVSWDLRIKNGDFSKLYESVAQLGHPDREKLPFSLSTETSNVPGVDQWAPKKKNACHCNAPLVSGCINLKV